MSNEVIQRRCRRSPTGIEDCFGSTGSTGSTGTTGGAEEQFFFEQINLFPFSIALADPPNEVLSVPIQLLEAGQAVDVTAEIIFSPNSAVPHTLAGRITVDGVAIPGSVRSYVSPATIGGSSQLLVQWLIEGLDTLAHTVGFEIDLTAGPQASIASVSIKGEIA